MMQAASNRRQRSLPLRAPDAEDLHVLFVAEDEFSDLADLYRLKLGLDGYRVTIVSARHLTAQQVRELNPDFVLLEVRRPSPQIAAVWARVRWARGAKFTPIVVLSPKQKAALSKVGINLEPGDHVVDWSRSPSLSSTLSVGLT